MDSKSRLEMARAEYELADKAWTHAALCLRIASHAETRARERFMAARDALELAEAAEETNALA